MAPRSHNHPRCWQEHANLGAEGAGLHSESASACITGAARDLCSTQRHVVSNLASSMISLVYFILPLHLQCSRIAHRRMNVSQTRAMGSVDCLHADAAFGPQISPSCRTFDFTRTFEESFFVIAPSSIFVAFTVVRAWGIALERPIVRQGWLYNAKLVRTFLVFSSLDKGDRQPQDSLWPKS